MRKFVAVIIVIFILLVMGSIFGFIKDFDILDNLADKAHESFGLIGVFLFYSLYGGVFITITRWLIKTSWRSITGTQSQDIATEVKPIIDEEQSVTTNKEVKPTINKHEQKHTTSQTPVQNKDINKVPEQNVELENEDSIYEKVMLEIEEDKKVKATWARALAQSDGDKDKAEALYIKFRVNHLKESSEEAAETEWDKKYAKMQKEVKDSQKSIDTYIQPRINTDDDVEKTHTELDVFFYPNNYTEAEKKKILGNQYDKNND